MGTFVPETIYRCNLTKGGFMFEFDEEIVEELLKDSVDFKRLYDKHLNLKREVDNANAGYSPVEDMQLEGMKKEKLFLKDQMAQMIGDYRKDSAA